MTERSAKKPTGAEELLQAVQLQDAQLVKKLTAKSSFKPEFLVAAVKGTTALHVACTNGTADICQLLLRKGSPIDARDEQEFTPLLCAASQRHLGIVRMLLDAGADPTLHNGGGTGVVHYLIRTAADQEVSEEQRALLQYCFESGADVNARNKFGETPLHQASMRRQVDMCLFLLDHGANVNQTSAFGDTALHKAVMLKHAVMVKTLLARGADPNIQSSNGPPRALLDSKSPTDAPILEMLVRAEASYRDTSALPVDIGHGAASRFFDSYQRAAILAGGSSDSVLSLAVLRSDHETVDTLLSTSTGARVAIGKSGSLSAVPAAAPKITVSAAVDAGPRHTASELTSYVADASPAPAAARKEMRRSLESVAESDESPRAADAVASGHHARVFGAVGSGIRRRTNSTADMHPVTRNSPSVVRLVRQPSVLNALPIFTPDASFRQEESGFGRLDDVQLIRVQESYRSDFVGRDHSVFLSSEGVVCIMAAQTRNSHVVLVLDAGGYRRMTLPAPQLAGKDFCQGCLQWISANVFPGVDVYMVEDDAALKASLAQIESMAPENSSCFRIGVVYATDADESEEQMFDHKASQAFLDFLRIISDEIELLGWGGFRGQLSVTAPGTSYYTSFRGCEVMFHVAPLLSAEEKRRLIGNDTAVLYFHESSTRPFPSAAPRSAMSQVYAVVQPVDDGRKLRVGFMSRKKVADYGPAMPLNPVFDVLTQAGRSVFKDFLLCRLLNGYRSATVSPPLNQMLKRPRVVVLAKLLEQYPIANVKKKFVLRVKK